MSSDRKIGLCYKPFAAETSTPVEDYHLKETNAEWTLKMQSD